MSIEHRQIELDPERIEEGANHFVESMNDLVGKGYSIEEVFMVALYALGNSMFKVGVVLNPNKPLRETLPPFFDGYQAARRSHFDQQQKQKQSAEAKH